ncbi:hypothetical protein AB9F45_35595, partial [Rhizobium leguminosarum]|uniref:hypothetical protein n=1 Tax=Rhizobium leguminosarum TaxID=384 RepID=UPI003F9C2620
MDEVHIEFGIKFGARKGLWRSEHYGAARIFGRAKDAEHLALLHNFMPNSIWTSSHARAIHARMKKG